MSAISLPVTHSFRHRANVLDDSGSAAPLSSLLSPLSLAASAKVDSHFSHHFIPSWTVAVHCQEVRVTLRHSASASGNTRVLSAMM